MSEESEEQGRERRTQIGLHWIGRGDKTRTRTVTNRMYVLNVSINCPDNLWQPLKLRLLLQASSSVTRNTLMGLCCKPVAIRQAANYGQRCPLTVTATLPSGQVQGLYYTRNQQVLPVSFKRTAVELPSRP